MTTSKRQELPLLLLLRFDGDNKPLKVGHVKFGSQINYKINFPIMREISSLGQSHNHGDDANIDSIRQCQNYLIQRIKLKKNKTIRAVKGTKNYNSVP